MSFAGSIRKFGDGVLRKSEAVYRLSVENLAEDMRTSKPQGGNVPYATGNLTRSLRASTSGMPEMGRDGEQFTGQDVGIVTATLKANTPVWLGYQARYARRLNYGMVGPDKLGRVYDQAGSYFVEKAIANWQQSVNKAVLEIKGGA